MQHIPYPADTPTADPANHIMMISAPLVAQAPQSPRPNSSWQANAAIIKELLNLSSSINLEGEITPVEAWHRLHEHPDFWRLDKAAIHRLKGDLSSRVRCCGCVFRLFRESRERTGVMLTKTTQVRRRPGRACLLAGTEWRSGHSTVDEARAMIGFHERGNFVRPVSSFERDMYLASVFATLSLRADRTEVILDTLHGV